MGNVKINDRTGQRFGSYSLVRLLGQGSMSEVYLGEHVDKKTQAAIKILQAKLIGSDQEDFLTWTRTIKQIKHPHIVNIWETGLQEQTPFLAMTYAPHGSLRAVHPTGSRLPLTRILSYMQQTAAALQYLHDQKLIYRDLKPHNLLLETLDNVVLADIALSLVSLSSRSLSMQRMMGDVTYMAPEQLQGMPGPASDQYALGIVIYEWLSGKVPFNGTFTEVAKQHAFTPPPPLHTQVPEITPAVAEVVQIALSKEPQQRFATIQAFSRAFEQACQKNQPPLETRTFKVPEASNFPNRQEDPQKVSISQQPLAQPSHNEPPAPQPLLTPQLSQLPSRGDMLPPAPQSLPTPPPSQQPARPRKAVTRTVLLCTLALLIVASGGSLLYLAPWQQHSTQQVPPGNSTVPPTSLTATAQADSNAEATANAEAVSDDIAAATAMQNLYMESTQGVPTINDPLHANNNNGWDENTSSKHERCAFINGEYHIIEPQQGSYPTVSFYPCFANNTNFRNFALQANVTILKGDSGGLVFMADNVHTGYCYFGLYDSGIYQFFCYTNGYRHWGLNSQKTAVGNKSPQTNQLTVIVRDQRVFLYVNNKYVGSIKQTELSEGQIGAFAEDDVNEADVVVSNVQVWRL